MNEYKSLNKYLKKDKLIEKKFSLVAFFNKILFCFVLLLVFLIFSKSNNEFYNKFYDYVYDSVFPFTEFRDYFGDFFPSNTFDTNTSLVFSDSLIYHSSNLYKNGVMLKVDNNYLIPFISDGVVVFIGDKDDYGKCVIVQQSDSINVWYCNINNSSFDLYDYVNKGDFLGEVNGDFLYLVFEKNGEFLDYKEYI